MKIVVVLGRPCAGKSTLAKSMAACLNAVHVSVGALIREARMDPAVSVRTDAALCGREMFDPRWIAELIAANPAADARRAGRSIIIDAAPPIDQALAYLGWTADLVLHLRLDEQTALTRSVARGSVGGRNDDELNLFVARSRWCIDNLPTVLGQLCRHARYVEIEAGWPREALLRQALSAWLLSAGRSPNARILLGDTATLKQRLDAAAPTGIAITDRANIVPASVHPNSMLLLLKPGIAFPPDIFSEIDRRARTFGYSIRQASVWAEDALRAHQPAKPHLDLAYLWANWPAHIAPELHNSAKLVSARDLGTRLTRTDLEALWQEAGPNPPRKFAQCAWGVDLDASGTGRRGILVNGHIGPFLDMFEAPSARVYAIVLTQVEKSACWGEMRTAFLGSTHPRQAAPGSLRRDAVSGKLGLTGQIDFRNNAFHLSAGPFEAVREIGIWLGNDAAELGAAEMGFAVSQFLINRPVRSRDGELIWSNEASETLDADTALFRALINELRVSTS